MSPDYVPPALSADGFHCPHCGVYAHQHWGEVRGIFFSGGQQLNPPAVASLCVRCERTTLWLAERMIYPPSLIAPRPHADLPDGPRASYEEAREVVGLSARAGAALIRLTLQQLLPELGATSDNLNKAVAELVALGLPPQIQQAMDAVRVIGNNAVHPGQIDLNDTPDTALALFDLVNLITETMITQPRAVQELYERLPETAREQIEKRDG